MHLNLRVPRLSLVAAIFAVVLAPGVSLAQAQQGERDRLRPDRVKARLLCATDRYAVWLTSDVVDSTKDFVVQTFTHRVYRQELTEPEAVMVASSKSTGGTMASVMADGTVVLGSSHLSWHQPDGTLSRYVRPLPLVGIYPDGVLLNRPSIMVDKDGRGVNSFEFVPFRGHGIDPRFRIKVVPAGVKGLENRRPVRSGDRFAWFDDSQLHVFDLRSGRRSATRLDTPLQPNDWVAAFDGETVVASSRSFDATTGKALGEPKHARAAVRPSRVFAVRHRIAYYQHLDKLFAADLTSQVGASVELQPGSKFPPGQSNAGLIVWDGERWVTVPWLREWNDAGTMDLD